MAQSHHHLPSVGVEGAINPDGHRTMLQPADVRGRFTTARRVVFYALIALWIALPWIPINGHPAVFLDIEARKFFLFGLSFNAQDIWLLFFLLTGFAFGLVYITAVLGRAWCGWACPQTVFLEGVYRPIERLVEGPREKRLRRNAGPFTFDKARRKVGKQALFFALSVVVAHIFISYFVSLPTLFRMVRGSPSAHPEAFLWAIGTTGVVYFNFAWFREQFCIIICPYGRLQSLLVDSDSLVVGYDVKRGEPRGKAKQAGAGDCVDCKRCVAVCPTGVDIRKGQQLECLACTACIDACDDVMTRLGRPRGLVRYDSQTGLAGLPRRLFRPRLVLYTALLVAGAAVATIAFWRRTDFEANLLRLRGAPYRLEAGTIRNSFEVHLYNKRTAPATFTIKPESDARFSYVIPMPQLTLEPMTDIRVPIFVTMSQVQFEESIPFALHIQHVDDPANERVVRGTFLGARP